MKEGGTSRRAAAFYQRDGGLVWAAAALGQAEWGSRNGSRFTATAAAAVPTGEAQGEAPQ